MSTIASIQRTSSYSTANTQQQQQASESTKFVQASNAGEQTTDMSKSLKIEEPESRGAEMQRKDTTEALKKAVEEINRNATSSEAQFAVHEATNRIMIKIVDRNTKEVIKEFPPEKTLDMIAKAWELAGLTIDERR